MKILGLDFETTGLDSEKDRVIEIGAVLWETERKSPLQIVNYLIKHAPEENVVLTQEIRELTHIHPRDIEDCGITPMRAFEELIKIIQPAKYIVAHNGALFDKLFYDAELKRLRLANGATSTRPWIDTRTDVPYPPALLKRNQDTVEEFHGVRNGFPHRAVFDALGMLQILSHYKIEDVIALSKIPMIQVKAMVSYDDREKAKERGYHWDETTRSWIKGIKENALEAEKSQAGFEIVMAS